MDIDFWIQFIEIPIIATLFVLWWVQQRQLTTCRIELAKDYVSQKVLGEFESRHRAAIENLEKHLAERLDGLARRIEAIDRKLDLYVNKCAPARQDNPQRREP